MPIPNPLALLGAVTPRMVVNGALHWLRSAAGEARARRPQLSGPALWLESLRQLGRARAACRPPAAPEPLDAVTAVAVDKRNRVTVTTARGALRVAFVAEDVVELRVAATPDLPAPFSWSLETPPDAWAPVEVAVEDAATQVTLRSAALRVVVAKQPCRVRLEDVDGRVLFDDGAVARAADEAGAPSAHLTEAQRTHDETAPSAPGVGRAARPRAAAPRPVSFRARFDAGAAFYGLGEKASALDHAGRRFELWNRDPAAYDRGDDPLYLSAPFLVGLQAGRAAGLFFDNPHRAWVDVGATERGVVDYRAAGGELRLYVMAGTPAAVLQRYTALTGRARLPPLWAFGFHQSRYSYFPQARVLEVAKTFRARRLPCDVLHLDIHHMDGYRSFTWHPTRFPQPRAMLEALHRSGFKALSIVDPGIKVEEGYRVYDEGVARGAFLRWPDGARFEGPVWPGGCHFPDFSSPAVRAWWGEQYRGLLEDGVDAFWNDMNELALLTVPTGATVPDALTHDAEGRGATHAEVHNVYGQLMARASCEGLARLRPGRRPVVLTRSGWAGVQRHALHWTGDNKATWDHLRLSLQMVLNLGLSGVPFTGPDTGGFTGNPEPELFARWMQLSAFLPFFRVHSVVGSRDQEPWAFGEVVERVCRATLEWRYRVLPYLYTAAWQATRTGAPVARAMAFEFPDDARFLSLDDQLMVGDALLVAPVLERGARRRAVQLPRGAWFDFWTGARHEGGGTVLVDAPLDAVPVFARGGAVVPLWPVQQHVGERPVDTLELLAFAAPGERVSRLYEDDGERPDADAPDGHRLSALRLVGPPALRLTHRVESGRWLPPARRVLVRFVGLDGPAAVAAEDARVVRQAWDERRRELLVELDAPAAFGLRVG